MRAKRQAIQQLHQSASSFHFAWRLILARPNLDVSSAATAFTPWTVTRHFLRRFLPSPAAQPAFSLTTRREGRALTFTLCLGDCVLPLCPVVVGQRVPCSRHVFFLTSTLRGGFQQTQSPLFSLDNPARCFDQRLGRCARARLQCFTFSNASAFGEEQMQRSAATSNFTRPLAEQEVSPLPV